MPASLTLYSFENNDGDDDGWFQTMDYEKAKKYAQEYKLRLIANEYMWDEAVPVEGDDYSEPIVYDPPEESRFRVDR